MGCNGKDYPVAAKASGVNFQDTEQRTLWFL